MLRFSSLAIVLAIAALAATSSSSQEPPPARGQAGAAPVADADQPMSIFNDKVRRYKFDLEEAPVTPETVEEFMIGYRGRKQPTIIGAYADAETNSLVVVCPPEAEEAVRIHLATWIIDRKGLSSSSLKVQKRALEFRRKTLLAEMADLELKLVEADVAKAEQLQARFGIFEAQLSVVEQQIEIVNRYVERQEEAPANSAQATGAR